MVIMIIMVFMEFLFLKAQIIGERGFYSPYEGRQ